MAAVGSALYERLKAKLKMRLVDLLDGASNGAGRPEQRAALEEQLRQSFKTLPEEFHASRLSPEEAVRLLEDVIDEVQGRGPLERFFHDETITEIMVNGPQEIYVERAGRLERADAAFEDTAHLMAIIERLLGSVGLSVNESEPLCDAVLPDGSRINVIVPPLVLNGPVVTIRRKSREWTLKDYVAAGALSEQAAEFLEACVLANVNLVISGGTSTGKTTIVGILSTCIPQDQRIITIENVAELELPGRRHWVRLVSRPSNLQGRGEIPLRSLVKNALRMRPDRIILGEARGSEALDIVQAMHSGHDGFLTVLHANSPQAALERLETMMLMSGLDLPPSACRMQIASAVDLVIHLSRFADGRRCVSTISQVLGVAASQEGFALQDLFTVDVQGLPADGTRTGALVYRGACPKFLAKFHLAHIKIPTWLSTT